MTPADLPVALGVCRLAAPDWSSAACLIEDPELFFPISSHPDARTREAKAVCHTCPVRDTCLTWALDTHQDFGIWGGLTEDERRTIQNRNEGASRLNEITHLLTAGESPEIIARRLHSSLATLARWAYRASAPEIGRVFFAADRVVDPGYYHLKDLRANTTKRRKRVPA